jgi:hypothetical protein
MDRATGPGHGRGHGGQMSSPGSQPAIMAVVAPPAIFLDSSLARLERVLLVIAGTALFRACHGRAEVRLAGQHHTPLDFFSGITTQVGLVVCVLNIDGD